MDFREQLVQLRILARISTTYTSALTANGFQLRRSKGAFIPSSCDSSAYQLKRWASSAIRRTGVLLAQFSLGLSRNARAMNGARCSKAPTPVSPPCWTWPKRRRTRTSVRAKHSSRSTAFHNRRRLRVSVARFPLVRRHLRHRMEAARSKAGSRRTRFERFRKAVCCERTKRLTFGLI